MTLRHSSLSRWRFLLALLAAVAAGLFSTTAQSNVPELKLQVQLVWATDDEKSPDPLHKELTGGLAKKFASTYRWKKYFEVNNQNLSIPTNATKKTTLSPHCAVEVKYLGGSKVEVTFEGKGKKLVKVCDVIKPTEPLIIAGDAQNSTAWFVVISLVK